MAWIEIDGKEIPLLEPPETQKVSPRRLFHVLFKYQRLIRTVFLSISLPLLVLRRARLCLPRHGYCQERLQKQQ